MIEHMPALLIVAPLIGAALCVFLKVPILARGLAILIAFFCLVCAWNILERSITEGEIIYLLGGWPRPLGIEYRIDAANGFVLFIVALIGAVVMPFGAGLKGMSGPEGREHLFYAAFLLCLCGLLGITITGDAFNVFVFLEITSLSSYTLIALGRSRRALMAAFSYLVMGTIGGTFILVGIGFLFALTGTLNMVDMASRLPPVVNSGTGVVALGFLFVGSAIKLAIFPLYQWLPNAYSFAPSKISAFLSATATKVSYYVLLRVLFTVFGAAFVFDKLGLDTILMPLSVVAMFVGSVAAIYQSNLKRLLAYSSVAQIGYMTLGLSFINVSGLTGGIVHLFNHALMKCGLFLVVGCIVYRVGSTQISSVKGLMREMPITMSAFVVGGLSIIGIPGTVGFVSKWYLVLGALEKGYYVVAGLILLSSLLAVMYIWKVIEVAVFEKSERTEAVQDAPMSMLVPTWILMIGAIFFGLSTDLTVGVAKTAAETLLLTNPQTLLGGMP